MESATDKLTVSALDLFRFDLAWGFSFVWNHRSTACFLSRRSVAVPPPGRNSIPSSSATAPNDSLQSVEFDPLNRVVGAHLFRGIRLGVPDGTV